MRFYGQEGKQASVLLRSFELPELYMNYIIVPGFLDMDIARKKKKKTSCCRVPWWELNLMYNFTCKSLKQAYNFLKLKLFRIMYLLSDVCITVHAILKVSNNTV